MRQTRIFFSGWDQSGDEEEGDFMELGMPLCLDKVGRKKRERLVFAIFLKFFFRRHFLFFPQGRPPRSLFLL